MVFIVTAPIRWTFLSTCCLSVPWWSLYTYASLPNCYGQHINIDSYWKLLFLIIPISNLSLRIHFMNYGFILKKPVEETYLYEIGASALEKKWRISSSLIISSPEWSRHARRLTVCMPKYFHRHFSLASLMTVSKRALTSRQAVPTICDYTQFRPMYLWDKMLLPHQMDAGHRCRLQMVACQQWLGGTRTAPLHS